MKTLTIATLLLATPALADARLVMIDPPEVAPALWPVYERHFPVYFKASPDPMREPACVKTIIVKKEVAEESDEAPRHRHHRRHRHRR